MTAFAWEMFEFAKRGPKPPQKVKCGWCHGTGTMPAKPGDRRSAQTTCARCHGNGEM